MSSKPWTLRDLRRVVGRRGCSYSDGWHIQKAFSAFLRTCPPGEIRDEVERLFTETRAYRIGITVLSLSDPPRFRKGIDRLISAVGPNWPVSIREQRKKDTSAVVGSTQTGDQTHGGDSASGEVPDGEGGGERKEEEMNQSPTSQSTAGKDSDSGASQGSVTSSEQSDVESHEEAGGDGSEPHKGELTDQAGNLDSVPVDDESDILGRNASESARDSSSDGTAEEELMDTEKGGEDADSLSSRPIFGGENASLTDSYYTPYLGKKSSKDVVKALRRLVQACDVGAGDPSPRIDGRRLVVEMVSKRYSLHRAVRREKVLPAFLLMADVSGSCAGVCEATVGACLDIAQEMEDVIVVLHSNGIPTEVWYRGTIEKFEWVEDVKGWWDALIQQYQLKGCVAFGDMDAEWIYRRINEKTFFAWLDDYAACSGARPVPPKGNLREALNWQRLPDVWWQGINSIERAAAALRATVKQVSSLNLLNL